MDVCIQHQTSTVNGQSMVTFVNAFVWIGSICERSYS